MKGRTRTVGRLIGLHSCTLHVVSDSMCMLMCMLFLIRGETELKLCITEAIARVPRMTRTMQLQFLDTPSQGMKKACSPRLTFVVSCLQGRSAQQRLEMKAVQFVWLRATHR